MVDLLKLQMESGFYGHCFTCGELVPPDRLAKGGDTCKPECQSIKRKAQRKFQRLIAVDRLLRRRKFRHMAAVRESLETAERTARKVSQEATQ
jgi:predicted nucleic acid-binding Zn ribbon protein